MSSDRLDESLAKRIAGVMSGADAERAAIVAFLRGVAEKLPAVVRARYGSSDGSGAIADEFGRMVSMIADDVARGAHLDGSTVRRD